MNKDIIESAKKYVNILLAPLEHLYYHQYDHALNVMYRAIELGIKEGLKNEDLEVLALAGLFHDTGFIIQYEDNEYIGAKIARNYLKGILYPEKKIQLIEKIILATSPNYKNTKNIFEKIIKDADLDNLGRKDFFDKFNDLKKELKYIKKIKEKDPDWIHGTIQFLESIEYQTETQKKERGQQKEKNINLLKNMVDKLNNK